MNIFISFKTDWCDIYIENCSKNNNLAVKLVLNYERIYK